MTDAPTTPASLARVERRRPLGTIVLALLLLLRAGLVAAVLIAPWLADDRLLETALRLPRAMVTAANDSQALLALVVFVVVGWIVSALVLWRGSRIGWLLAILFTGVSLAINLVAASRGEIFAVWMTLDVVTVFYLNQREVRDYYGVGGGGPTE